MSIARNVVANFMGQAWRAAMGLAFVPAYISYMGLEAYGLVGVFAVLNAWLGLLDLGTRPALAREMARFTGGARGADSIRDLLRGVEWIVYSLAALGAAVTALASGAIASEWVRAERLPVETVARALAIMGCVAGLRLVESVYVGALAGLQRQALENALSSATATARGVGAVLVLAYVSPTIDAFFIWQAMASLVSVAVTGCAVHASLPAGTRPARFSRETLLEVRAFAGGMVLITLLAMLLTQTDKILLTRLVTLEEFARYSLAAVVANALFMLMTPISTAFGPRFAELAVLDDTAALSEPYHRCAQLIATSLGASGAVLIAFSDRVLLLWTGDPALAASTAGLLSVLAFGTLLNGLMTAPYLLQLAHGWTSLAVRVNAAAVAILVPAILWAVPRFGAIGAAWAWAALNVGYVLVAIRFMHRRLLPGELRRWYLEDTGPPLAVAFGAAHLARALLPRDLRRVEEILAVVIVSAVVLALTSFAAPLVRRGILQAMRAVATRVG